MKQQTFIAAGVVTKGNGDAFISPEKHASLSAGGGQAGQGYPCVLAAAFSAGASSTAGNIGYQAECAPTLKSADGGNMVPSVLCLNDQGGSHMDLSNNHSGTLRAQDHGHAPLVMGKSQLYENHGIDARYTGPLDKSPTVTARFGTGGNNIPLALSGEEAYGIAGNIIDRKDKNGGNGIGIQKDISYTLNATDQHCVFSQQRSDIYRENSVASTQSARQYKDATDLICSNDGNPCEISQSHQCGGYPYPAHIGKYVRRLTPLPA